MEDVTQPRRASTTCAWVNVIYGCNERCTYCVVPVRFINHPYPHPHLNPNVI